MSTSRQFRILLPLTAVLLWTALPGDARAYDNDATHQHVVNTAVEIFGFPDLLENLPLIAEGAWCEDEEDHVYDTSGAFVTLPHFWIADEGDEQINWWGAYGYENAWMKARIMINRARDFYVAGDHVTAYHYLGHVCHLLADMTVPAHAHYDEHSDDAYENWMASWHGHITAEVAALYGPVPEISDDIIQQIMDSWGGISPGPLDLLPPLYFLMYTANQRGDYFASDGDDGNSGDRHGWMDYTGWPATPRVTDDLVECDEDDTDVGGMLSRVAYKYMTYAVSSTARLYEVWRDHLDPVPPVTHLAIAGPDSVHDGWRPGNVTMTLTADDNYSGVHEIRYGGYQYATNQYTEPVLVDHEGISYFSCQSMDRFGNKDELQTQMVKIDRTPPVLAIISPTLDGYYLSSGTLTIDYEADDEPSGLFGFTATLDGQPVGDGQSFDMAIMAGFHTLVLTAEDMAGNTSSSSVEFSIKIDATVRLQPVMLDLGSAGGTLTAFVGFPAPYSVAMIDVPATILAVGGVDVPANAKLSELVAVGPDGLPERSFKFKRASICAALAGQAGTVEPVLSGVLADGTEFWGAGALEVFSGLDEHQMGAGNGADDVAAVVPTELSVRAIGSDVGSVARIEYALPADGDVSLRVYDVRGRLVTPLDAGSAVTGVHRLEWDGRDQGGARVPRGVYFVRVESRGQAAVAAVPQQALVAVQREPHAAAGRGAVGQARFGAERAPVSAQFVVDAAVARHAEPTRGLQPGQAQSAAAGRRVARDLPARGDSLQPGDVRQPGPVVGALRQGHLQHVELADRHRADAHGVGGHIRAAAVRLRARSPQHHGVHSHVVRAQDAEPQQASGPRREADRLQRVGQGQRVGDDGRAPFAVGGSGRW